MAAAVERHLAILRWRRSRPTAASSSRPSAMRVQAAFPTAPARRRRRPRCAAGAAGRGLGRASARCGCGWRCMPGRPTPDARGDYLAAPLNRLSRLLATGHGGQILLSQTVQQLTRGALPAGAELRDLGEHRLRDLLEPERVFQLLHPDLPGRLPAPRSRSTTRPQQPAPPAHPVPGSGAGGGRDRRACCGARTCSW